MHSLEPEIVALRDTGAIAPEIADRLIRIERREILSIDSELRAILYIAVAMLTAGVGMLLAKHVHQIGPLTIVVLIAMAAGVAYAFPFRKLAGGRSQSAVDEYLLLLASLLVSADVAYAERQFHLLDKSWPRHFLLLAILHGFVAYLFTSRTVLTLSIAGLAAWLGVSTSIGTLIDADLSMAQRGFLVAALLLVWKLLNHLRGRSEFGEVFDQFIAIIALASALKLAFGATTTWPGVSIVLFISAALVIAGMRLGRESFVIYAVLATLLAIDRVAFLLLEEEALRMLFLFASSIAAAFVLFRIHQRMRWREL
jgi:Predicted membrane protein (DUF2157)